MRKYSNVKNIKPFLYILFLSIPSLGFSQKSKTVRWHLLEFKENGQAYLNGDPYTGMAEMYFPKKEGTGNRTRPKLARKAGFKKGILHGEWADYKPNGDFEIRETFKDGIKHGPFYYYYPSGGLEIMGSYDNEELNGVVKGYYKTGELHYINRYSNGERNGLCESFYKNGSKLSETRFRIGYPRGEQFGYYPDSTAMYYKVFDDSGFLNGPNYEFHRTGCPALEEYYKNGKLDSVQRAWEPLSCALIRTGMWNKGKKHGMHVELNTFGDTIEITTYQNGLKSGYYAKYTVKKEVEEKITRRFRTVETEGVYQQDLPNGYWVYGKESCYRHREGEYKLGVKIRTWKYYDRDCNPLLTQVYDSEGNLLEEKMHD